MPCHAFVIGFHCIRHAACNGQGALICLLLNSGLVNLVSDVLQKLCPISSCLQFLRISGWSHAQRFSFVWWFTWKLRLFGSDISKWWFSGVRSFIKLHIYLSALAASVKDSLFCFLSILANRCLQVIMKLHIYIQWIFEIICCRFYESRRSVARHQLPG